MLKRIINRYIEFKPKKLPPQKISNRWLLEKGTIKHRLAQESLIMISNETASRDFDLFSDNGDLTLSTLYIDMLEAYRLEIKTEERKKLRVLDD